MNVQNGRMEPRLQVSTNGKEGWMAWRFNTWRKWNNTTKEGKNCWYVLHRNYSYYSMFTVYRLLHGVSEQNVSDIATTRGSEEHNYCRRRRYTALHTNDFTSMGTLSCVSVTMEINHGNLKGSEIVSSFAWPTTLLQNHHDKRWRQCAVWKRQKPKIGNDSIKPKQLNEVNKIKTYSFAVSVSNFVDNDSEDSHHVKLSLYLCY